MLKVFESSYKIIWASGKKENLYFNGLVSSIPILSEEAINEEVWDIKEFSEAYDFFKKHSGFYKYFSTVTLFNKPVIYTPEEKYMTVKNFEPFKVIKTYEDITDKVSIKDLANYLKADDFCRFLRDRQVNFNLELTK
jgi:hypothetical protein